MSIAEPKPASPDRRFQFSLRTLLLVCVMLASSLAVFGAWGVLVFALAVGLASYVRHVESLSSWPYHAWAALCLMYLCLALPFNVSGVHESARRSVCESNLNQIVCALLEYHKANGVFPPAYIADKNGKPMHSWRTLLLPHLDRNDLYKAYNFTEPWDGPKNRPLSKCLRIYMCPSDPPATTAAPVPTSYVAVVGPGAAWEGEKSSKIVDLGSSASSTIMLVEIADSHVPWADPRDLSVDALAAAEGKSPPIMPSSCHFGNNYFFFACDDPYVDVAMADSSVHSLCFAGLSRDELRKVLQIGGCGPEIVSKLSHAARWHVNWRNIAALAVWLLSVVALLTVAVRSRKKVPASPIAMAG